MTLTLEQTTNLQPLIAKFFAVVGELSAMLKRFDAANDVTTPAAAPTFAAAAADYLKTYKTDVLSTTADDYRDKVRLFGELTVSGKQMNEYRLDELTRSTLQKAFNKLSGYSKSTVHKIHVLVKAVFDVAVSDGTLVKNPTDRLKLKFVEPKERKIWTAAQCSEIMRFAETDALFGLPMYILHVTGIRSGEMRALKPADYDYANHGFNISRAVKHDGKIGKPKNGKARCVVVAEEHHSFLERELRKLPQDKYILDTSRAGSGNHYITESGFGSRYDCFFKRLNKHIAAKIPAHSPHSTRHTWITHLLAKGTPLAVVSAMVGHSSFEVTAGYTHLNDFELLRASSDTR